MPKFTADEIRKRFETSKDFNEIFEAFEHALEQHLDEIELYRLLFWNNTLTSDELCLFGEKLAKEIPTLAYDTYMWLANVFEVVYSVFDNYELALVYYKKAATARPDALEPYLNANDCYEADLNIPAITILIDFLKQGSEKVSNPMPLYKCLANLYELHGNDEMHEYYRRKANEGANPSEESSPSNEIV
jgi:tetratricopeptide (TPR) repeat protein